METSKNSKAVFCNQFHGTRAAALDDRNLPVTRRPCTFFGVLAVLICLIQSAGVIRAADIPPRPSGYFNDLDSLVKKSTAQQLNRELSDFEHQTSNQLIVVIISKLPTGVTIGVTACSLSTPGSLISEVRSSSWMTRTICCGSRPATPSSKNSPKPPVKESSPTSSCPASKLTTSTAV